MNEKDLFKTEEMKFDQLLTAREVAKILNVSRPFVYLLIQSGDIPSLHFGRGKGAVRIRSIDLSNYIKSRERV